MRAKCAYYWQKMRLTYLSHFITRQRKINSVPSCLYVPFFSGRQTLPLQVNGQDADIKDKSLRLYVCFFPIHFRLTIKTVSLHIT